MDKDNFLEITIFLSGQIKPLLESQPLKKHSLIRYEYLTDIMANYLTNLPVKDNSELKGLLLEFDEKIKLYVEHDSSVLKTVYVRKAYNKLYRRLMELHLEVDKWQLIAK